MKKRSVLSTLILVLSLYFSLAFISSFDIALPKTTYYPGETMQVEIPNAFIGNLQDSNILIYASGAVHSSPAVTKVIKYDNKYHFYAILPTQPGNYQLKIEGIEYWDGSVQSSQPIIKNFSINPTNASYLSFNPGYVYTTSDFSVSLKAYNQDQQVSVDFPELNFHDSFSMGYGDMKTVYFSISKASETIRANIKINDYNLPVVILINSKQNVSVNTTPIEDEDGSLKELIAVDTNKIEGSIMPNTDYYYQIAIVNKEAAVKNINLSSPISEINVSPANIPVLASLQIINITINTKEDIYSYILISIKNSSMKIPINLTIVKTKEEVFTNIPPVNEEKTCSSLGGIICIGEEKCSVSSTTYSSDSSDGRCCIGGECKVPEKASYLGLIGFVLLVVLVLGGFYLYKKANQGEGPEFFKKIFKKKETEYKSRMNPASLTPEVRASLSKI